MFPSAFFLFPHHEFILRQVVCTFLTISGVVFINKAKPCLPFHKYIVSRQEKKKH